MPAKAQNQRQAHESCVDGRNSKGPNEASSKQREQEQETRKLDSGALVSCCENTDCWSLVYLGHLHHKALQPCCFPG